MSLVLVWFQWQLRAAPVRPANDRAGSKTLYQRTPVVMTLREKMLP